MIVVSIWLFVIEEKRTSQRGSFPHGGRGVSLCDTLALL